MATVACPGCGLPRSEAEVGTTPCPVCDAPLTGNSRPPLAKKKTNPDPTAGMAADASELHAPSTPRPPAPNRPPRSGSRAPLVAVAFILGTLCGVGGVLGFQAINWSNLKRGEPEVAAKPEEPPVPPQRPAVAPMPHEARVRPLIFEPEADPDAEAGVKPLPLPAPGVTATHDIHEPDVAFSVPALRNGERLILTGEVKALRVHGLDAGATLDASGLQAGVITVTGKIDNRSTLKLFAPSGTVHVTGKIDGSSLVEVSASGGEVKFMLPTTPQREGSKIDGGSRVTVTARMVEFKGDITGADTKVAIILTRTASLRVATVSGKATVEYKSQASGWSQPPDVVVGTVAGTATVRKIE